MEQKYIKYEYEIQKIIKKLNEIKNNNVKNLLY